MRSKDRTCRTLVRNVVLEAINESSIVGNSLWNIQSTRNDQTKPGWT